MPVNKHSGRRGRVRESHEKMRDRGRFYAVYATIRGRFMCRQLNLAEQRQKVDDPTFISDYADHPLTAVHCATGFQSLQHVWMRYLKGVQVAKVVL
jgi:hypothetical protein